MHKKILLFLICTLLLCGCGKEKTANQGQKVVESSNPIMMKTNAVEDDQIATDLQGNLSAYHQANYGYPLTMREYTLQKSLSEDRIFTAQYEVLAESVYADFQYTADIQYTKYGQGWTMDSCSWKLITYNVVRYPDESAMEQIKQESGILQQKEISLTFENGMITYEGVDVVDWSTMAYCSKAVETKWYYDVRNDWWIGGQQGWSKDDETCILSPSLEGTWSLGLEDTATISNVSDSGFDLEINAAHYETDKFHVEVGNIYIFDEGDSVQINFTSDQFNFRDPKYYSPSGYYGDFYGTAPISIYLYKEPQERLGQVYNMYINFLVLNNRGLGADVYGSDLYYLAE